MGDADGDGVGDLLVGTQDFGGQEAGHAYLVRGPFPAGTLSLHHADLRFEGDGDDNAGAQVPAPGDLDGDGLGELLIGGTGDDDGGTDAGAAWLWFGSSVQTRLGAR